MNDKHVVCTAKCWRHGCNHVVFNVKLGHAALILNRLLRLCLCLCLCSEFAKSLLTIWNRTDHIGKMCTNIQYWHHLLHNSLALYYISYNSSCLQTNSQFPLGIANFSFRIFTLKEILTSTTAILCICYDLGLYWYTTCNVVFMTSFT